MVSVKKFKLKRILIVIISAVLAYLLMSAVATKVVYDGIFERCEQTSVAVPDALSDMVSDREVHRYHSGDNLLCGYLYRCQEPSAKGLMVMATGFHASTEDYLWQIKSFLDFGWSIFIFDPTGCFASEGQSAVGFPQILLDLDETMKYVEKNNRFGYNELVLFGHSRGGYAVCCALEAKYDIAAIVSVSGLNSAMEGVIGASANHVGALAYGNYGGLWAYQALLFGTEITNKNAADSISGSDVPVLIIHGNNDSSAPKEKYSIISHREEILSENVEYYICTVPGQDGHTDLLFDADGTANDVLMCRISDFLSKNSE